jgi:predicted  nucleic acid-binding Zn-ribbon protein
MKASPEVQKQLLTLQSVDNRLQQLDHSQRSLPEHATIRELQASLGSIRRELAVRSGAVEDARTELSRTESDVAVVEARIARDEQRLAATSSVKDAQGLEHELDSLKRRRNDLEEIELTVMERLEELEAALAETVAERDRVQDSVNVAETSRDAALEELRAERTRVADDRAALLPMFSEELIALYERQRARYGIGAALLRGGVSLGSNVRLTGSDLDVVRRAAPDDVVICPDSSAILVRTEESGI